MGRPHVVTHALLSVDGRIEGFPPELELYYEVAGSLQPDAILAGSGTMVAAAQTAGVQLPAETEPIAAADSSSADAAQSADPALPLMVIVDSRGRVTRFDWLRATGLWRDVLVLGSERTPASHHQRLRAAGVELRIFGDDLVDLTAALQGLSEDDDIQTVRVDAGPGLNTALVRAGLLDEVSVLVAPYLIGHGRTLLDGQPWSDMARLSLLSAQPQANGHVWIRYAVLNA